VIRETGRRHAPGLLLVDAERAFENSARTQHGIPGEELFYEHVHMNPEGNHELAQAVFREIISILPGSITQRAGGSPSPPDLERCSERIALTPWDRAKMLMKMLDLEERPPFTNQIDHEVRMERLRMEGSEAAAEKHPAAAVERQAQIYQRALERSPDDLFFRAAYAALLRLRGEPDAAVQQWELLLKQVPDTVAWLREMGRALLDANRPAESAAAYQRAIDVWPGRAEFLLGLGIALDRQGKTPEAIEIYRETVRMDPGLVAARLNLGMTLEEQGKRSEAIEQYREAVRVQPGHAQARLSLARSLSANGDVNGAIESFAEAVKLDPKLVEARLGLARSLAAAGRTGEAIRRYRDLLDLRPDWEPALDGLALLLAASENPADRNGVEAVELSEKACRLTGFEVPQFLDTLAAAYAEAGRFDQARLAAERGIQMARSRQNQEAAERIRAHLTLFESGRPLRIRSFDGRF
jgi:tetratricopeptide (TPR) repeat protein